jgi:SAM-dependent methyltransferase
MIRRSARYICKSLLKPAAVWRVQQIRNFYTQIAAVRPRILDCPVCGFHGFFGPFGWPIRPEAQCSQCGSLERHRLFVLWVQDNAPVIADKDILHFAPELSITNLLRSRASHYESADITPGAAMLTLDIERIDRPAASYDLIVCSHVLEHVDDKLALREMFRVLRPGGLAILLIPVVEGWDTYENPAIVSQEDRLLHFGQSDHLRIVGADVRQRIKGVGFDLSEFAVGGEATLRYGLIRGERLFIASKPR